jgi:hypothetical protein
MPYSLGTALILLRLRPELAWVQRIPTLGAVLNLVDRRGMMIYLWSGLAAVMAPLILRHVPPTGYDAAGPSGHLLDFGVVWLFLLIVVPLLGWLEDVAAARPPSFPWTRAGRAPGPSGAAAGSAVPRASLARADPRSSARPVSDAPPTAAAPGSAGMQDGDVPLRHLIPIPRRQVPEETRRGS